MPNQEEQQETKQPSFENASLQQWYQRGQLKQLCDHSIFTIDEGSTDKPAIVLIHGFPTSTWDWQPIWSTLRKKYRLVCLDMLGFGFSDKPNQRNYTIHRQADLFEALIAELNLHQYHVLAHDYGDTVTQELLARQIEGRGAGSLLSCCFLNGGLFPETHRALLVQKLMLSPLGKVINRFAGFKQFSASFSSVFGTATKPSEQALREFWEVINFNQGRHLFYNGITYILDRREHRSRWVNALQKSPVPLSLINGSADPVSGAHMIERYKELDCRLDHLKELPKIGHYPQVEAPFNVAESYLSFLASFESL